MLQLGGSSSKVDTDNDDKIGDQSLDSYDDEDGDTVEDRGKVKSKILHELNIQI